MRKKLIPFWIIFTRPLFIVLHAFILLLNFRRRDVLNKSKSWYESQILHSILDQENLFHLKASIPRFFARLCVYCQQEKTSYRILVK